MFGFSKTIVAVSVILAAPTVSGLGSSLRSTSRNLSCYDSSASCKYESHACDEIDGHKYWTVHSWSSGCSTKCVSGQDLEFLHKKGFQCGPCPVCNDEDRCDLDHTDKMKHSIHRMVNGKCEAKCIDQSKIGKYLLEDEYKCGICPIKPAEPGQTDCICPYGDEGRRLSECDCGFENRPPTPEKCVMKRAAALLQYEPNFPANRPDVYIEVQLIHDETQIFQFYPPDHSLASIPIQNKTVYDILFAAQDREGFNLRYVSKNGAGEWNSCTYSPIAFDLDRDGEVKTISGDFQIDIIGDGGAEELNFWFAPTEGILIDIKNKEAEFINEIITGSLGLTGQLSGQQLLGNSMNKKLSGQYTDGFNKLRELHDSNKDGIIKGKELDGLYIWVDRQPYTILDPNDELHPLAYYGIISLNTTTFEKDKAWAETDGGPMLMHDRWFSRR